jgi:hypothetical protein
VKSVTNFSPARYLEIIESEIPNGTPDMLCEVLSISYMTVKAALVKYISLKASEIQRGSEEEYIVNAFKIGRERKRQKIQRKPTLNARCL